MKCILCISGSRADYGLLEWPVKVLREAFRVDFVKVTATTAGEAFLQADILMKAIEPHCLLILGDRWEILQAAIAAHLRRVPIAHIGGGDVTLGSYDDAMRDCISRLATWHFPTSDEAGLRLIGGLQCDHKNVHPIGNIAIDYIRHGDWRYSDLMPGVDFLTVEKPPYVAVSYQAETIDGTIEWDKIVEAIGGRDAIFVRPNADAGSDKINALIDDYIATHPNSLCQEGLSHDEFLRLIAGCIEFIGNSSAMLYEAPELGVKCRMIGKRQAGRVVPTGDGKASERIKEVLCRCL